MAKTAGRLSDRRFFALKPLVRPAKKDKFFKIWEITLKGGPE